MAKSKSRKSSDNAPPTRKAPAQRAKRESAEDRADRIRGGLRGARAAVMTTIIALEGNSQIWNEIALNLRFAALRQIDAALELVEVLAHGK